MALISNVQAQNVDIAKLKSTIEALSIPQKPSIKVLSVTPKLAGSTEVVDIVVRFSDGSDITDVASLTTIQALITSSTQRRRIVVSDDPNQADEAGNKNYIDARVQQKIEEIKGDAPGWLDTLGEISDALKDNPIFGDYVIGRLDEHEDRLDNIGIYNATVEFGTDPKTINDLNIEVVPVDPSDATLGKTYYLNVPDASASSRGVVTTGTQTISGSKTFSSGIKTQAGIATSVPLITKGAASQTANLFEAQNSSGTTVLSINNVGDVICSGTITQSIDGNTIGSLTVASSGAATKTLITKGFSSQSANLFEAQNNAGQTLMSVDASGNISSPTIDSLKLGSPTGSVIAFAGTSAPSGWLLCDGSAINTYTYRQLHAVISSTYGGTTYQAGTTDQVGASTTFTIPDLRSRAIVGKGSTVNTTLGSSDSIPEASRSLTHNHSVTVLGHYHDTATSTPTGATLTAAGQTLAATDVSPTGTIGGTEDGKHTHGASDNGHGHSATDSGHSHGIYAREAGSTNDSAYFPTQTSANSANDRSRSTQLGYANITVTTGYANIVVNNNNSGHSHNHTLKTNIGHTHSASSVSGKIGKITGGVDGSLDQTVDTTSKNNHNYLILNYIIKT